jgi:hypothetical protein
VTIRFPAFCPNCGLIFAPPSVVVGEGARVRGLTLSGNVQRCPQCGGLAELPEGTFDVADETIRVLSASDLTRERLLRLQAILEQAGRAEMPTEAAADAIADEAPALKRLFDRYPKMGRALIKWLEIIVVILLAQGLAELRDDSATRHDVQQAVEQAIMQVHHQQSAPPH